ncbi:hypothetical protein [Alysiella filiformis]|uniref:Uncharacterized protein n=1 Tax=Alysiella filiformis DSM 16848 TaxID=1120981 RepID=A0A286E5G7_9NEIS|nr:hypothetical protein [Alysiella filiformis]QMT30384.1 hypothetical protein H3L97_06350 [Alysiella filiformis]UBQ56636.1 hypothetical protein JF568_02340 [Alysiella filiformis DSM 16848]SOD66136.1 hypothetical protein SAMN02746062_00510 [Alysiella filiformis DSM 16848]
MKKHMIWLGAAALVLSACQPQQNATTSADQKIAENEKKIELLKQEAEIQRLQKELAAQSASSPVGQVYQLAASEVANTIPQDAQKNAKAGDIVQGSDGQQYTFDPDTGSWLLYGAVGAALGYMAANAMNKNKYAPVTKPTAAVSRVYNDYRAKNPTPPPARPAAAQPSRQPAPAAAPTQNPQQNQAKPTPNYRPTQQGYSNTTRPAMPARGGFGGRRR